MDVAALIISALALVAAGAAVAYARTTARQTQRQADAAAEQIHLAYTPRLEVTLKQGSFTDNDVLYEVRNAGSKDLDSVAVERPLTSDKVRYPIARLGTDFDDQAELGPLALGEARGLLLRVGPIPNPPEYRVRITSRAGGDTWSQSYLLEPRRTPQIF